MHRSSILCLLLLLTLTTACSSNLVIVDSLEVDQEQLAIDKVECQGYADELDSSGMVERSALLGGFLAGFSEWVFTGDEDWARSSAFIGAVEGGIFGAVELDHEKDEVLKNCLASRGYVVLN